MTGHAVLMVNDPRRMRGGELQYFVGSVEVGREIDAADACARIDDGRMVASGAGD